MDADQIRQIMNTCHFSQKHFGGVFASDEIPYIDVDDENLPQGYIFNYDPSYMSGSHWVAAVIKKNGNLFFDSYGKEPALDEMKDFLTEHYYYNHVQYQNNYSSTCGQWCVFFLWYEFTGQSFPLSFKFDPKDTLKNDYLLNEWVNKQFDLELKPIDKEFLSHQISREMNENMVNEDFPLNY